MRFSCRSWGRRLRGHFLVDGEFLSPSFFECCGCGLSADVDVCRTCPEVQPWLYGYDALQEVEKAVGRNPELFSKKKANL